MRFKYILVTYECIDKDMFRRVECIHIDTQEDTTTKEVAAPTVTGIYALALIVRELHHAPSRSQKEYPALAKKQRILPGLNTVYSDDGGDHYLHDVDISDVDHTDNFFLRKEHL